MLFAWDKTAGMHLYKGEKPREEKEKRKEKELVGVARDVFGRQEHITYIDLCEQIQQILDVKERTAKVISASCGNGTLSSKTRPTKVIL